jgi:hypothetical protein
MPRYGWNTAKFGTNQPINQSINQSMIQGFVSGGLYYSMLDKYICICIYTSEN